MAKVDSSTAPNLFSEVLDTGYVPEAQGLINRIGRRYGRLVVVAYGGKRGAGRHVWECRCDCGNTKPVESANLSRRKSGRHNTSSCGCLQRETVTARHQKKRDRLVGAKFGRLTILEQAERSPSGPTRWRCKCDCGQEVIAIGTNITRGLSRSCGCLIAEAAAQKAAHGETRNGQLTVEYIAYNSARARCNCRTNRVYPLYGGRGIEFRFTSVEQFIACVGRRPSPQHSLDRYPNKDGHYEPGNVRWATKKEQANNTRCNRIIIYRGEPYTLAQLADKAGLPIYRMRYRLDRAKWCVECAVNLPMVHRRYDRPTCTHQ